MPDHNQIRDAASTLAYLWRTNPDPADQCGLERILLAYPDATRAVLGAYVVRQLHEQASSPAEIESFLTLLADIAGIEEDGL